MLETKEDVNLWLQDHMDDIEIWNPALIIKEEVRRNKNENEISDLVDEDKKENFVNEVNNPNDLDAKE